MKCSVVATTFTSNCRDTMPWSLFTPLCYRRTFRLWKYITLHMKKHNGRKHWGCLERKSGFFLLFEQLSMLCLQFTPWPSTIHHNYFRCKTQTALVCWCERFDKYHDCPCGERMLLHLCQSHFVAIKSSSKSNKIDNITKGNFTNRKKFCLDVKAWMPGRKLNFLIGLHFCESIMLEMPFLCAVMMHRDHRICCQPLKYIVSIWLNNHWPQIAMVSQPHRWCHRTQNFLSL